MGGWAGESGKGKGPHLELPVTGGPVRRVASGQGKSTRAFVGGECRRQADRDRFPGKSACIAGWETRGANAWAGFAGQTTFIVMDVSRTKFIVVAPAAGKSAPIDPGQMLIVMGR